MLFTLIKQVFIALLVFSGSLVTKCISLNNQPYLTRPTLIDLNTYENNERLRHCPFMVSLDRFSGR